MLVLTRKIGESIVVGGTGLLEQLLKITVVQLRGGSVTLGFAADATVPIHRYEVWERLCAADRPASPDDLAVLPAT